MERAFIALFNRILPENRYLNQTFSQNGEDAILSYLFLKKFQLQQPGIYVDVGAYHPFQFSNTKILHNRGWKGINIDLSQETIELFDKYRPQDKNLRCAIIDSEGDVDFYEVIGRKAMNSTSKESLMKIGMQEKDWIRKSVPAMTLARVLDTYLEAGQVIDYLNVDTEGADYEVLQTNNWDKYQPLVVSVELDAFNLDDVLSHQVTRFLTGIGYEVVAKTFLFEDVGTVVYVHDKFHEKIGYARPF